MIVPHGEGGTESGGERRRRGGGSPHRLRRGALIAVMGKEKVRREILASEEAPPHFARS